MACSAARLAANRANALKSTGPTTVAGKEVSRLNAFRHGLAGEGNLVGPDEDAAAVAALAAEFERDFKATGKSGQMLAYRAALLSIRLKHLGQRQLAAESMNIAAAKAQFDTDRSEWLDEEITRFEAGGDEGRIALSVLEAIPDGVLHLIDNGEVIFHDLASTDPAIVRAATERDERWLGLKGEPTAAPMVERVRAELIRLDAQVGTMDRLFDAIAADRDRVGKLARFDATPEALLAQRYEAAAERGMHRALRAIITQNRERTRKRPAVREEMDDAECAATMATARQLLGLGPYHDPNLDPHPDLDLDLDLETDQDHDQVSTASAGTPPPVVPPEPRRSVASGANAPRSPRVPAPMGSFRADDAVLMKKIIDGTFCDDDIDPRFRHLLAGRPELPISASRI